jgi:hypothetical protein
MRITSLYRGTRELDPGIRVEDVIALILLGGNEPLGRAGLSKCNARVSVFCLEAHMHMGFSEHRCRTRCVRALYVPAAKVTRKAKTAPSVSFGVPCTYTPLKEQEHGVVLQIACVSLSLPTHLLGVLARL